MTSDPEKAVLGTILIDQGFLEEALGSGLTAGHFQSLRNELIYLAMLRLRDRGQHVDLLSVQTALESEQRLETVGGVAYLSELETFIPDVNHFSTYVELVKVGSFRSNLMIQSKKMSRLANQDYSLDEFIDKFQGIMQSVVENVSSGRIKATHSGAAVDRLIEKIRKNELVGVETGFTDIDYKLMGLKQGGLYVLAGRPGMGKTTLGLNIAHNIAEDGARVLVFSLEMSAEELSGKLLTRESLIPLLKIYNGALSEGEWLKIENARQRIERLDIELDDTGVTTTEGMLARARSRKLSRGLNFIMVDYIQLMEGTADGKKSGRVEEVSHISRSLKKMARQLRVPVLALSQLNRSVEKRPDRRPILSDLRESGSIEQDADAAMFLFRPGYYKEQAGKVDDTNGKTEVIVAKHRSGETGSVYLKWRGEISSFVDEPLTLRSADPPKS